ncbi:MAG: alkyl hydroperoxide reductase/Thiol specific antioxidant/Mal allergen [Myxococcales bacterium]|nr:alkyl hydroperoxide reductase/Thiol specific antioxidant/Mal allergen [Myxococcales bacterium]
MPPPSAAPVTNQAPRIHPEVACAALAPEHTNPVLGDLPRSAVPLAGVDLDGGTIDLAKLRGQVVLVSFQASFDMLTAAEQPTFEDLSRAIPGLTIVRVASEESLEAARAAAGASTAYRTILDRAERGGCVLGPLTSAWGVTAVPESFLIDRAGNVRFYFVNKRDWSSPDAVACVRSLLDDTRAAITDSPALGAPETCVGGPPAIDPDHHIRGTITVAPRLRGLAKGTSLFLIAKRSNANGRPTGMPLAVARLTFTAPDLAFALTDADSMIADAPLTGDVVISARLDQDDDALTKQSGDLLGEVRVTVPSTGVTLVLDRAVP